VSDKLVSDKLQFVVVSVSEVPKESDKLKEALIKVFDA